jgi:prophage regulatory protein
MSLIWRENRVKEETGLSRTTLWRLVKMGQFPPKVQLGPRATGWRAEEVIEWSRSRGEAKNGPVKHGCPE